MLRSLDSCTAVARAIVAARAGSCRRTVAAVMRAALSAWSASRTWRLPSASATAQVSLTRSGTTQVSSAATPATASAASTTTATVPRSTRLRMERVVERDPGSRARQRLDRPGHRVAAQQQPVAARQLACGDHGGGGRRRAGAGEDGDLGAGGDVQPGLDDAVVAQRDPDAAVGAQQAALPDDDALPAAAGQRAPDRGAAADVGAVPDDDPLGDAALDHRAAQRARVAVHEPL